ncbi:MAG: hypothetical protein U0556_14175 [Dehalococcoidia bacterium]
MKWFLGLLGGLVLMQVLTAYFLLGSSVPNLLYWAVAGVVQWTLVLGVFWGLG